MFHNRGSKKLHNQGSKKFLNQGSEKFKKVRNIFLIKKPLHVQDSF